MTDSSLPASKSETAAARLIRTDILRLAALVFVAAAAFLVTRAVAASNRAMNLRDAAEWYARGQQELASGSLDQAVVAFRRAATKDRNNKQYVLALAHVLGTSGHETSARAALLELRDTEPDDAEVNLQLARLAAKRNDVTEASRYYHNALYAPWTADQGQVRRRIRVELIRFLISERQNRRALSEVLALASDVPETAASHAEVAALFSEAGDPARALGEYEETLRLDPANAAAHAGAAGAAFAIRDYQAARRFLHDVTSDDPKVNRMRTVVDLIFTSDPLEARIGRAARQRRITAAFTYAQARFSTCLGLPDASVGLPVALQSLAADVDAYASQLQQPNPVDADEVEAGVDLVYRMERVIADRCVPQTPMDEALLRIGELHGAGAP